jgi:PAS domain S-box-containing protein
LIIPQNLRARHWQGFTATMRTGESRYGAGDILAVPALRKDGARISVEFNILPFRGDDGSIQGIAAVLRDVTARFEQTRALQRELAALRAAAAG